MWALQLWNTEELLKTMGEVPIGWMNQKPMPKLPKQRQKHGLQNVRAFEIFLLLYHGLNSEVLNVIGIKTNET